MSERSFAEPVKAVDAVDKFDDIPLKQKRTLNEDYLAVLGAWLGGLAVGLAVAALIVTFTR